MENEIKSNGCGFASKLQQKTCVVCKQIHYGCNTRIFLKCLNEIADYFENKEKLISVDKFESECNENL